MSVCPCMASARAPLLVDSRFFHAVRPTFSNNRRFHASPSLGRYTSTPKINTDSLAETLEDHRIANRTVVRKVKVRRDPDWSSLSYGLATRSSSNPPQELHVETYQQLQKLRKLTKLTSYTKKLNTHQLKQLYPTTLKSSPRKTEQQSVQCNWLQYMNEEESKDGYSRLNDEIWAFEGYMSEIRQEKETARRVISEVEDIIKPIGDSTHQRPMLVGSRYTGMNMRNSNVDLMIPIEDPGGLPSSARGPSATRPKITAIQTSLLSQAARLLRATGTFSGVTVPRGHVPFVSAVHSATDRRVRIYCGVKPNSGMEYILNYKTEFPALRPLYIAIRMILETRGMLGTNNHTVDPYGLIMMIVAALKLGEGKFHRHDLGRQFLHVLRFYENIDLLRYGISVDPPELFKKRTHARSLDTEQLPHVRGQKSISKRSVTRGNEMLCLQDPADFMNDLGMSSFSATRLRRVFGEVYADVLGKVEAWDGEARRDNELMLNDGIAAPERPSLLRFALGSNYDHIEALRDKAIVECS
ncbi:putative polynucleotide adenylyltransferase [Microsporum audouinii]